MSPMVILSLLIPFIGTTLGSAMVFFLKKEINPKIQKILLGGRLCSDDGSRYSVRTPNGNPLLFNYRDENEPWLLE